MRSPRGQRWLSTGAAACTTGTALAGAALIGAAPAVAHQPVALPVVHVHDVTLTSSEFDPVPLETAFVQFLVNLAKLTGYGDLTVSNAFFPFGLFGLADLTPNQLLSFTGLGNVTLGNLNQFAGLFGLNQTPLGVLLAAGGVTDSTTLSSEIDKVGFGNEPLSNFYNLIGLTDYQDATLGDLATHLGIGNDPVSQLFGVLGLSDTSTLTQAVQAFGIGDTQIDTLLGDWGVADEHINGFLHQLGVSPHELFGIFGIDPSSLDGLWDPATGAFTAGTTVEQFADAAGLGHDSVSQLLTAGDLDDATLNELLTGVGLQDSSTVDQVLDTAGFNDLKIWDFLNGFGVYSGPDDQSATLNDFFTAIPGLQHTTFGGLLGALGLSDSSTIGDVFTQVPGLGDNTLSDLVGDFGVGDDHLSDLVSTVLGPDTTLNQYLADILAALTPA